MKKFTLFLILAIQATFSTALLAGVYKQIDEDGNVIYSDVPEKAGAKPIKPPPIMTIKPLAPTGSSESSTQPEKNNDSAENESSANYSAVQITNLDNDQAIRANGGSFSITIHSQPGLDTNAEHRFVVLVDGKKHQESTQNSFALTNMNRGTHSLTAQVHDKNGKILASSDTVVVHVLRASR